MTRSHEKLSQAIAYTRLIIRDLSRCNESNAVADVSQEILEKTHRVVLSGICEAKRDYRSQALLCTRWEQSWDRLYHLLNEGWDTLLIRRETRVLEAIIIELEKLLEQKVERFPASFEFYLQGPTPYQQACLARSSYEKGDIEAAKRDFFKALESTFECPYYPFRMKGVIHIIDEAFKVDFSLVRDLISTLDLDLAEFRDAAILAAIRNCDYAKIRDAVQLVKLVISNDTRDRAYQFLFDASYKKDPKLARKITKKIFSRPIRYECLALLATHLCTKDIEEAKEISYMIVDGTIREKVEKCIEYHQWQNYLRYKSNELPTKLDVDKDHSGSQSRIKG